MTCSFTCVRLGREARQLNTAPAVLRVPSYMCFPTVVLDNRLSESGLCKGTCKGTPQRENIHTNSAVRFSLLANLGPPSGDWFWSANLVVTAAGAGDTLEARALPGSAVYVYIYIYIYRYYIYICIFMCIYIYMC